jgi:hypothetical protein
VPNTESPRNPEQIERTLDQLMKESKPNAATLKKLIRRSSLLADGGQGFLEPASAVGKLQYIASKLSVDALELARIREMIKDYGKKIKVYEAKAHRALKKHIKQNTRRHRRATAVKNAEKKAVLNAEFKNIRESKRINAERAQREKNANARYKAAMKEKEDEEGFYFNSGSTSSGSGSGSGSSADQF